MIKRRCTRTRQWCSYRSLICSPRKAAHSRQQHRFSMAHRACPTSFLSPPSPVPWAWCSAREKVQHHCTAVQSKVLFMLISHCIYIIIYIYIYLCVYIHICVYRVKKHSYMQYIHVYTICDNNCVCVSQRCSSGSLYWQEFLINVNTFAKHFACAVREAD